jgi:tetratricopeptide (TPR) repeat protein
VAAGTPTEAELRAAVAADPRATGPAIALAEMLIGASRPQEALELAQPAAQTPLDQLKWWTARGQALKALGRLEEAADAYRRGTEVAPLSGVAEHNLAGVLGDDQRFAESEAATRRAFAKGLDAPETWLVHGRALMGLARLDEAEDAYGQAIRRRPAYAEAHADLAQLIWMRTQDAKAACAALDVAIAASPADPRLLLARAKLLEYAGDLNGAYATLAPALSRPGVDPGLHIVASQLLVHSDPAAALAEAERGYAGAPNDPLAAATLCQANLAVGRPDTAARIAQALRQRTPLDQHAIALLATAWRMLGDPRYGELYDYDRMVRSWRIDTPAGWPSLEAYLADLRVSLDRLHPLPGHPVGQSLRGGSQTLQGLERLDDPVVRAFFEAIDGPIRRHIEWLGTGGDPLRARAGGGYRFNGTWSARLRPGGFHTDHLHPKGWISSACYIALPGAVGRGREGWIKFGQPGVPTRPLLPAEHFIKPEPGLLVLFPSYMWHGTVPFTGDEPRLTIAFDLSPA